MLEKYRRDEARHRRLRLLQNRHIEEGECWSQCVIGTESTELVRRLADYGGRRGEHEEAQLGPCPRGARNRRRGLSLNVLAPSATMSNDNRKLLVSQQTVVRNDSDRDLGLALPTLAGCLLP